MRVIIVLFTIAAIMNVLCLYKALRTMYEENLCHCLCGCKVKKPNIPGPMCRYCLQEGHPMLYGYTVPTHPSFFVAMATIFNAICQFCNMYKQWEEKKGNQI